MKKKKSWLDLQIILASLAVTVTVGLWNVFAMGNRQVANAAGNPPVIPPPADPTNVYVYNPSPTTAATLDPNAPLTLPKVHILLGGSMPVVRVATAQPAPTGGSSEGGTVSRSSSHSSGGGTANPPPPPASNSGSSKP